MTTPLLNPFLLTRRAYRYLEGLVRKWLGTIGVSIRETRRSPREVGAAIGTGVFLGCTPFFGFHTLLAIAASFLLGLNVVFVWLGTQISNPLFAGVLSVASIAVGKYLLRGTLNTAGRVSLAWLTGSIVVGAVLGTVSGVVSYFAAERLRRSRAEPAVEIDSDAAPVE